MRRGLRADGVGCLGLFGSYITVVKRCYWFYVGVGNGVGVRVGEGRTGAGAAGCMECLKRL